MERVLYASRELPPLRFDVAEDPRPYDGWVRAREALRCAGPDRVSPVRPAHVVMIVDGRPPLETAGSLASLQAQSCATFKLTLVVRRSWEDEIVRLLGKYSLSRRCGLVLAADEAGAVELLEHAFAASDRDAIALIYPGDVWAPDTLSLLSSSLESAGVVYADEDCVDHSGCHVQPRLKPSYSPEFLLHADYVGRPLAMTADVVARLPAPSSAALACREHDLALRACQTAATVHHVPEVLCHRLVPPSPPADQGEASLHLEAALTRQHEPAVVLPGVVAGTLRIVRRPRGTRSASIIIPFRDQPRFLRACLDSIDRTVRDVVPDYVLVDNGSDEPETATLLEMLDSRADVRVLNDDRPFNWAELNNAAAARSTSDVLVFLNNDIEALTPGWLDTLCGQVERPDVGVTGARLLYPDHRVQHCGVVIGLGGAAGHLFVGLAEDRPGYLEMAVTSRECSAVTGACLATRRSVFEELGGFDESLGVDLNDIDYCLRSRESGRRVVYEATAELVHHESPSRGTAGDVRDIVRFVERWKDAILAGDPYLNPHLTRVDSSCALRDPGEEDWWQRWYTGLSER